ncbi:acetamidase/formamidase family protein [soil metagenome]
MDITQSIPSGNTISSLSADTPPVATVQPSCLIRIETNAQAYGSISAESIDSGKVSFSEINRLTGPVFIEGAQPGDVLGFTIQQVDLGPVAYVPYIARWRYPTFPRARSSIERYPIRDGSVHISEGLAIDIRPMVGCIATAPANAKLSSLSPTVRTGGNLDIQHVRAGATIWLPVETPGALFAIGDVHASMGSNEPLGAGMECGGSIAGVFHIARGVSLTGPRIESAGGIHFVGSHRDDESIARQTAVRAAWAWLTDDCGLNEESVLALCAAALDVALGGPAGCNYVASFDIPRLRASGILAPRLIDSYP